MNLALDEGELGSDTDSRVKRLHLDLACSGIWEDDLIDREALFVCCDEGFGYHRNSQIMGENCVFKSSEYFSCPQFSVKAQT